MGMFKIALTTLILFSSLSFAAPVGYSEYVDSIFTRYTRPLPKTRDIRVKNFRVIVLSDMTINRQTHGEWGYAAFVEGVDAKGKRFSVLFDTGAETGTVWYNIQKLKDPDAPGQNLVAKVCGTQSVILSHNHQDHTSGLLTLRRNCMKQGYPDALKTAYLGGPEAMWPREDRSGGKGNYVPDNYLVYPSGPGSHDDPKKGTIQKQYADMGGTFVFAETPKELFPGVWTSGKIFRTSGEKQYWQYGEDGPMISPTGVEYHDNVPDDHGLVLNTESGLVVLTGCGHAGVVNYLDHAREWVIAGNRNVVAVLGGIHLFMANPADLKIVKEGFDRNKTEFLIGSHCTGTEAVMWLRENAGLDPLKSVAGAIGTVFGTDSARSARLKVSWVPGPAINKHPSLN